MMGYESMNRGIMLQSAVACLLILGCCQECSIAAQKSKAAEKKIETVARFELPTDYMQTEYKVLNNPRVDGTAIFSFKQDITEGYYVGLLKRKSQDKRVEYRAKIFRLKIDEIRDNNLAVIKLGDNAASFIKKNDEIMIFRPEKFTTLRMKKLPEVVDVELPTDYFVRYQTKKNMLQLAIAVHEYHDAYDRLPPAAISGPDGKPWHSWRVLILPFLGEKEAKLFKQYKMNEPWNGPHNKKLLSKMPDVFRCLAFPRQNGFYTNYAVAVGKGTPFPPEAATYQKDATGKLKLKINKKIRFHDFKDGTSKFKSSNVKAAMIGWCDGATTLIEETLDTQILEYLFLRADGFVVRYLADNKIRSPLEMIGIVFYRENGKMKAKFTQ